MSFEIISANYNKATDRDKLGQEVVEEYDYDNRRLTSYHDNCNSWYKYYRGIWNKEDYPFRSKIFINMIYSVVETIKPRLMGYLFNSQPYVSLRALDRDSHEYIDQTESALNSQYNYPFFKITMNDWITQGLIMGLSTLKLRWRYKEKKKYLPAFDDFGNMNMEEYYEIFDAPRFECVNQRNMFYPDEYKDIQEKAYIGEMVAVSREWLEMQAKAGLLDGKAVRDVIDNAPEGTSLFDIETDKQFKYEKNSIDTDASNKYRRMYVLLYYYNNEKNIHAVVEYNTRKCLKVHPNFYSVYPYSAITPISDPYNTEGISVVEGIYDIQEELNAKRNLSLDWFTLMLAPIFLVDPTSGLDVNKIIRRPGAHYKARDIQNAIKAVDSPAIPPDFYRMLDLWAGDIQLVTGVNDYTKGTGSRSISNETASGISMLTQEANQRFKIMIDMISCGVMQMVEIQKELNTIFWRENKNVPRSRMEIKKIADGYVDVNPNAFLGNYNYYIGASGSPDVNPLIQKQQLLEFLSIISKIPQELYLSDEFKPSFANIIKEIARLSNLEPMEVLERTNIQKEVYNKLLMEGRIPPGQGGEMPPANAPQG